MRALLLSLCLAAGAQAGQTVCEGGRCALRPALRPAVTVTKSVVRTTEKVVTAPRRIIRSVRSR